MRDHTVISREVSRNKDRNGIYNARTAHTKALKRLARVQTHELDRDVVLCNCVLQE